MFKIGITAGLTGIGEVAALFSPTRIIFISWQRHQTVSRCSCAADRQSVNRDYIIVIIITNTRTNGRIRTNNMQTYSHMQAQPQTQTNPTAMTNVSILKQAGSSNGKNTMETINPLYQHNMGQRTGLSFLDAKSVNLAYCSGKSTTPILLRTYQP